MTEQKTEQACVVIVVEPNGKFVPYPAKKDDGGGVRRDDGKGTYISRPENWGTYTRQNPGLWEKPREYPAVIAPYGTTQLLTLEPRKPTELLDHPTALQLYLDNDYLGRLKRANQETKGGFGLNLDWTKRIPRWAWLVLLCAIAVGWTYINGGRFI